jgi:hypothetical protein
VSVIAAIPGPPHHQRSSCVGQIGAEDPNLNGRRPLGAPPNGGSLEIPRPAQIPILKVLPSRWLRFGLLPGAHQPGAELARHIRKESSNGVLGQSVQEQLVQTLPQASGRRS